MIQSLKLRNFRNLSEREFFFSGEKIIISGDNGHGKTNLLEAIGLIGGENLTALDFDNLVTKGNTNFFIECQSDGDKLAIAYEMNGKKKQYSINGKKTSKTKFLEHSYETISFSPMEMNTLFLGPSLRRDFLDKILRKAFPQYEKLLKNYKNIVRNRNLTLKNIQKGMSEESEINFWNDKFLHLAKEVYQYRFLLSRYIETHIPRAKEYFLGKVGRLEYRYLSKVAPEGIESSIMNYLQKNMDRDIILGSTHIGPHVDDFGLFTDGTEITQFASRGEIKSVMMELKYLESEFIKKQTGKSPIILIDDLFSELDQTHENFFQDRFSGHQIFISTITKTDLEDTGNKIYL